MAWVSGKQGRVSLRVMKIFQNGLWLEKERATHSSVLAWRIPETREPGELLSMGSHTVRHD